MGGPCLLSTNKTADRLSLSYITEQCYAGNIDIALFLTVDLPNNSLSTFREPVALVDFPKLSEPLASNRPGASGVNRRILQAFDE